MTTNFSIYFNNSNGSAALRTMHTFVQDIIIVCVMCHSNSIMGLLVVIVNISVGSSRIVMTAGESSPEVVFSSSWNERVTALSCPCMCILLLIRIDFIIIAACIIIIIISDKSLFGFLV